MTFLAPISALVAAALTVPVLLALYMLKLRRRPVRVGSILFWARAAEDLQANVPLRRVRPSWLLLLHVLGLGCLLAAFARPMIPGAAGSAGRLVLLIDASASMSARDEPGGQTRLDGAKARARALIQEATRGGNGGEMAVVAFAREPRTVQAFSGFSSVLFAAVESIAPTDQPGDLAAALRLADVLGSETREEAQGPARVVLLSDGVFPGATEPLESSAALTFERIGRAAREGPPFNAGITRLGARRDERDPGLVRVLAEVSCNASEGHDVALAISVDGSVVDRRAVLVPGRGKESVGQADVTWPVRVPGGGLVAVSLSEPDALTSDDLAALVLSPPRAPRLTLVREADSADHQGWIVEDVLRELRPAVLDVVSPGVFDERPRAGAAQEADLIVFDGAAPEQNPATPTLALGVCPSGIGLTPTGTFVPPPHSLFWDRADPLLRGVSLDTLLVGRGLRVRPDAGGEGARAQVVARAGDNPLIVRVAESAGAGSHLVVLFEPAQSNWPLQPGFAVFLANAVEELTFRERGTQGRAFTTSQVVTLRSDGANQVRLEGPVLEERTVEVPRGSGAAIGVLTRAGVYRAGGVLPEDAIVAVNLSDAGETGVGVAERLHVAGRPVVSGVRADVSREVWHWFVMAAAGLLAVEWLLYARAARA